MTDGMKHLLVWIARAGYAVGAIASIIIFFEVFLWFLRG